MRGTASVRSRLLWLANQSHRYLDGLLHLVIAMWLARRGARWHLCNGAA
jgi:hypothetical protein